MTCATQPPQHIPRTTRGVARLLLAFIGIPLVAGWLWYRASDNPLWRVFRAMPQWCGAQEAQLSPVSPDGRYQVHVVQLSCASRFVETLIFLAGTDEGFDPRTANLNSAVLEIAGRRSVDAVEWIAADQTGSGRPALKVWLTRGQSPHNLHRKAAGWRDVTIIVDESQSSSETLMH